MGLYEQIRNGLSESNFNLLKSVSIEARKLLCNILTVDVSKRIIMPQIKLHSWFADEEFSEDSGYSDLTLDMQMEVAKSVQTKLKLDQWNPTQILAYVMSSKGRFGKTAGCFNLLARDAQRNLQESKAIVKPPTFKAAMINRNQSLEKTVIHEASQSSSKASQKLPKKFVVHQEDSREASRHPKSFWETGQGRAAVFALSQLRSEQVGAKEESSNPVALMPRPPPSTSQKRKDMVVRPFFKPEKMNQWRRSIRPVSGQQRFGRLKRVDTNPDDDDVDVLHIQPRKPLGKIDPNVV